jgi:hypothetical protein
VATTIQPDDDPIAMEKIGNNGFEGEEPGKNNITDSSHNALLIAACGNWMEHRCMGTSCGSIIRIGTVRNRVLGHEAVEE